MQCQAAHPQARGLSYPFEGPLRTKPGKSLTHRMDGWEDGAGEIDNSEHRRRRCQPPRQPTTHRSFWVGRRARNCFDCCICYWKSPGTSNFSFSEVYFFGGISKGRAEDGTESAARVYPSCRMRSGGRGGLGLRNAASPRNAAAPYSRLRTTELTRLRLLRIATISIENRSPFVYFSQNP